MEVKPKQKISRKLERYLQTIARRRSIASIEVSLFVLFDGCLMIGAENELPSGKANPRGINSALCSIIMRLGVDGDVRYLGFFDEGKSRRYNFALDAKSRPKPIGGFSLKDAEEAAGLMMRREAKIVRGSFARPPIVRQMLVW